MLDELTKVSEQSKSAVALASNAEQIAEEGNQLSIQTVSAIDEVNEASKDINEILSVIDNLAFQTNLLSLNAAVEAARAGDHGRGFAVVANEVGDLAGRSAKSAKQIPEHQRFVHSGPLVLGAAPFNSPTPTADMTL